jgi:5-methylcytosine-specific restriction protein A
MIARLKCLVPTLVTATPAGWKHDTVRGNRHQRGYGWEHEKSRERVFARDEHLCQPCLRAGFVRVGTHCDHVISKAEARSLGWSEEQIESDSNKQCICVDCHASKTARESRTPGGGIK